MRSLTTLEFFKIENLTEKVSTQLNICSWNKEIDRLFSSMIITNKLVFKIKVCMKSVRGTSLKFDLITSVPGEGI